MKLRPLPSLLVPLQPDSRNWRSVGIGYTLGAGLAAGALDLLLDIDFSSWSWHELTKPFLVCIIVWGSVALALRLARDVSLAMAGRIGSALDRARETGALPDIPALGWPQHDHVRECMLALLNARDERIRRLEEDAGHFRHLAEDMPCLDLLLGTDGCLRWINPAVGTLTGFPVEECFAAADFVDLWVYPKDRPGLRGMIGQALGGESRESVEVRIQRKDGVVFWVSCRLHPMHDAKGEPAGLRFSAVDIQARKDADLKLLETVAALRRAQALKDHYLSRSNDERMRLSALLDIVRLGILFVDRDRRIVYINQACVDMWGLGERSAVMGIRDARLLEMIAPVQVDGEAYLQHVEQVIVQHQSETQYDVYCRDGRIIRERSTVILSADGGRSSGRVWLFEDITETLRTQARLTELAERDPLTGLFNRRRFHEEIERQLAESVRRGEALGLLSFDLDGFKDINDRFGHLAGDEVLRSISREISSIVRRNELFFRLGGDEFAILVTNPSTENMAYLARRVVDHAALLEFTFHDERARVTVSLGIAMAPLHARDAEGLVLAADRAMYRAKLSGKNRWSMSGTPGEPEQAI